MKTIKVQPEQTGDSLPYPYFISPDDGHVGRQDIWKGKPLTLIGFNEDRETGAVSLPFIDFIEYPVQAKGMYPVFEHKDGNTFTYQLAAMSVTEMNV